MPLFIPPLVAVTIGAVGAAALAPKAIRAVARHARQINERLDALRAAMRAEQAAATGSERPVKRLRRDPNTGEYAPE